MDLKEIKPNSRGCLPIFYVEITARWRKTYNSKKFEPSVSHKMVYKGLANVKPHGDELKKRFFRECNISKPSEIIFNTFEVQKYELLQFLGYENQPFKEK